MVSELGPESASQNAVGEIGQVLNLFLIDQIMEFVNALFDVGLDFLGFFLG